MRGHVCQLTPYQHIKYEVDKCLPKADEFLTTPTSFSARKEVHRGKKRAMVRLEERQHILNDPTNSANVSVPMPGGRRRSSVKGKISQI